MGRLLRKMAAISLAAIALAGCDKCGNRVQFVAPSVQHACGDNSQVR